MGLLSIVAGITAIGGSAAAGAYVHGSICQASGSSSSYTVHLLGVENRGGGALQVFCPSPVDHDVGATLQWSARVHDTHNAASVSCLGAASDSEGRQLGVTATASSGNAFTGSTTLSYSLSVPAGSPTYQYVSQCTLPPVNAQSIPSMLLNVRVF